MNKIPQDLTNTILGKVKNELQPNMTHLLLKFLIIHFSTAVVTLSICSQFGISTFKTNINLMHSFMFLGNNLCYLLCGIFFTTNSVLAASFILKRDEMRALRFNKILSTALILFTSTGFFLIMKPELFLKYSIFWTIGSILGSALTLETLGRVLAKN